MRDFVEFRFSPIAPGQLPLLTVPNRDPVTLELDSFYQGNVGLSASDPNFQAILLSSVDTCLNVGGGSVPHRVVNVEAVAEPCLNRVLLGWREYEGWDDLLYYLVYRQDPGQGYVLRDTVLGSSYSDIDPTLSLGNVYRYLGGGLQCSGFPLAFQPGHGVVRYTWSPFSPILNRLRWIRFRLIRFGFASTFLTMHRSANWN